MTDDREPFLVRVLLVLMIFEVPYMNFFLIAGTLIFFYLTIMCRRRPYVNWQMVVLIFFIVLYFAIDSVLETSAAYKIWYSLSVIFIYISGYCADFSCLECGEDSLKIRDSIALIANTYFCYVLSTIVYSVMRGQLAINRNPLNIWTGSYRAATHYGTMLVFPVAYGIFLIITDQRRRKKYFGAALVIGAILCSVMTASRTILYFVPFGFICGYYYNIKANGQFERKHLNQIFGVLLLILIVAALVSFNVFNLQNILMDSQLGQRYMGGYISKISEDGRMVNIQFLFSHLKDSLWGGGYTRLNSGNLHNIYLNAYDLSGVIPFVLIIIFSIGILKSICRLFKNQNVNKDDQTLIFIFYVLAFLQLLMEPVMESVPVFFWCLLYISGMVEKCSGYRYID